MKPTATLVNIARGGIVDILVTNEVRDPLKIDRLARLPKFGSTVTVCVDDIDNVADLSAAAKKYGTHLGVLVEIDCGAGRCGVTTSSAVVEIAKAVARAENLEFKGIQAYQGAMQHMDNYEDRKAKLAAAIAQVTEAVDALKAEGLNPELVSGGGTGSYYFESESGVYNELQCGSYAFMDADYGRILVGLQVPKADDKAFAKFLATLGYPYVEETANPVYRLFLQT